MALYIRRLIWDSWNVPHIARHEVTPDEVEEVCHGRYVTLAGYEGRVLVLGPTQAERMLVAVLEPVERGVYYPVTARPASRKERRYYVAQKVGEH
jgi:uncharacterized protein